MMLLAEGPPGSRQERKRLKKAAALKTDSQQVASSEACAEDPSEVKSAATAVPSAVAVDSLGLIGAEAYLLEDTEQILKQREANQKIRALIGTRKGKGSGNEGSPANPPPESLTGSVAADAAAVDAAAEAASVMIPSPPSGTGSQSGNDRDGSTQALPEFTLLPVLPEAESSPRHRPLRPWQQHQHQQLLRLQRRQMQQPERLQKARLQEEFSQKGSRPQHQRSVARWAAATPGAAAIAAAGAAAATAGADFFGRLHSECLAALHLLRPSEAEERRKREAAGRVRAVCRLLWGECRVEVFGSSFTALGLPGSDLDVCVFAEQPPPLHDHYACSRCLCCTSSSSSNGNAGDASSTCSSTCSSSSGSNSSHTPDTSDARTICGAEAADGGCCCATLSKQRKRKGGTSSGLCSSQCCHGGSKGFQDLLHAAEQQKDSDDPCSRRETISKVREFAKCLRDLNQAAATAKRRGMRLAGGKGRFADSIEPIVSARVPICKFKDAETGVAVDLSFDQPSAVLTSLYVRHKLKAFALLRPLIVINKMLLRHWRLHEPFRGGIGSYLLFVMCLHFLQNNPHLSDTQKHRHFNLGHLLFQFLHYFGVQFNYENSIISVRGKGSIAPKCQGRWHAMAKSREERMMLNAESPLDPVRDLGRSAYKIMQVRAAWRKAYASLASRLMSEARQAAQVSVEADASQEPLLSCVFGSSTWPEELAMEAPPSGSCVDRGVTTPRPGLWIPNEVACATAAAVDGLAGSSVHLRRLLAGAERHCTTAEDASSICVLDHAESSSSSDSDSCGGMKRRPWERKPQQRPNPPSPLPSSARQNTHVIFDSSDFESSSESDAPLPVRGFAVSRSASPARCAAGKGTPRRFPALAATAAAVATGTAKDVSALPPLIKVDDSSYSESSVVEVREQHARHETNKQKRKRRKQRQVAERRKRQKLQ